MTTYMTTRKNAKLELNGNILSGDTYEIKGYIKSYLSGRWNADSKTWTVDADKLIALATGNNSIGLRIIDAPVDAKTTERNNWTVNTKYGRELAEDC